MPRYLRAERAAPGGPESRGPDPTSWFRRYRYDLAWGAAVALLVGVAFEVPHLHLGWLTPVINQTAGQYKVLGGTAPILGKWLPHVDWSTAVAVTIAVAVAAGGPVVARVLPWRWLVLGTWATSTAWAMSLALIDGWKRGFVGHTGGT
ncbi:MAG TPA: hypothetical protein VHZ02_19085, partial [Acidimicrobiales bacterium]|nr:hypothetical protein [Acidimicrobiales bacterium]